MSYQGSQTYWARYSVTSNMEKRYQEIAIGTHTWTMTRQPELELAKVKQSILLDKTNFDTTILTTSCYNRHYRLENEIINLFY